MRSEDETCDESAAAVLSLLLLTTMGVGAATSDVADAVMRGDSAAVRRLLTQKADVNAPQADGATALHWAVYRDDLATVDLLLKAGANAKVANGFGATPLSLAAENGNPAIVAALARRRSGRERAHAQQRHRAHDGGPDRQRRDDEAAARSRRRREREGDSAGHDGVDVGGGSETSGGRPAARRPRSGRRCGLEPRLAGPARAATPKPSNPRPSRKRDQDCSSVKSVPGTCGISDGGGLTPLVFAVRANDLESVRILLAAGADVNQVTNYGWSPLLVATQNRYYQLGSFLLDHGANPNLANKGAWSPLYIAVDNRNIEGGDYPLRKPDMDHLEFIKKLIDKGANVNCASQGVDVVPDGVHVAVGT